MTATVLTIALVRAVELSPMLITQFTEGHRYQGTDGITGTGVLRYTGPSPLYEISKLHAFVRFLYSNASSNAGIYAMRG